MIEVGGVPLIAHVRNFEAAGIASAAVIFNEAEKDCAAFVRERFGKLVSKIVVKTTHSSLESFRAILEAAPPGRLLVSTVDAFCPPKEFVRFVRRAEELPSHSTVLAVTGYVHDEKPLWVTATRAGRVTVVGGASGDAVTAGIYVFPEKVRRLGIPHELGRLRDFSPGSPSPANRSRPSTSPRSWTWTGRRTSRSPRKWRRGGRRMSVQCWGIYRELAHSPGRETDDAEILRAAGRELEGLGLSVALKSPDELPETDDFESVPQNLFVMCERIPIVEKLAAWERRGARIVNPPAGIRNTDRERTIALFERHGVAYPKSVLVTTASGRAAFPGPCWLKRGDVHATDAGDVCFNGDAAALTASLARFAARGITKAVVQDHVPGDLIKFYGVAGLNGDEHRPSWFQWFYHRDQKLSNHAFDPDALAAATTRAAFALGLAVYGGDAIVSEGGGISVIDLNAWPSFALFRSVAATHIAALLAARFSRLGVAR